MLSQWGIHPTFDEWFRDTYSDTRQSSRVFEAPSTCVCDSEDDSEASK